MLPEGLTSEMLLAAIQTVEHQTAPLPIAELYATQANVVGGLVSSLAAIALEKHSPYRRHSGIAFPDMKFGEFGFDIKASSHHSEVLSSFNHAGCYLVWRYGIHASGLVVSRIEAYSLREDDWRFCGSKASKRTGGRTPTWSVPNAASKAIFRLKRDGTTQQRLNF
jgi:hypothetical protein